MVGPLRLGYGNVVAAGSILRQDYPQDNQLIFENAAVPEATRETLFLRPIPAFGRILENNILYLANLKALEAWYTHVRKPFFEAQEFGSLIYDGAMEQLSLAGKERLQRLKIMAQKAVSPSLKQLKSEAISEKQALYEHMEDIEDVLCEKIQDDITEKAQEVFLQELQAIRRE